MSSTGLRVALDGGDIDKNAFKYDSTKDHLQVNLKADPKHIGLIDTPKITNFANGSVNQIETLVTIPHKLTFTPRVSVFIFAYDVPTDALSSPLNSYTGEIMILSGTGLYYDAIYYKVDEKNFYLKHYFDDSSAWLAAVGRTAESDQFKLRIKYMIHDNPGLNPRWSFDP